MSAAGYIQSISDPNFLVGSQPAQAFYSLTTCADENNDNKQEGMGSNSGTAIHPWQDSTQPFMGRPDSGDGACLQNEKTS